MEELEDQEEAWAEVEASTNGVAAAIIDLAAR